MSASTTTPIFTYSHSRLMIRTSKYAINPNESPVVIEYVSGIKITIKNVDKAIAGSLKFIFPSSLNISTPTITSIGYIAFEGMALKSGSIKIVSTKNSPQNTAVSPVLPPSSTPLALSANDVVVLTPTNELLTVATASASRALSSL